MIVCPTCQNVISDTYIIKATAVIQINYEEHLCNIRCRKCKNWILRIPFTDLIDITKLKDKKSLNK